MGTPRINPLALLHVYVSPEVQEKMCTKCHAPASDHRVFGREFLDPELWHQLTGVSGKPEKSKS